MQNIQDPPLVQDVLINPDQIRFNQYLEQTLGIYNPDLRNAIIQQGCFSFDSFIGLDEKDLIALAANIRKPGGMMEPPQPVVGRARANIPNPGTAIGFLDVRRLEFLRFYVHHCARIQRPLVPDEMTIARLQRVYHMKETEDLAKESNLPDFQVRLSRSKIFARILKILMITC